MWSSSTNVIISCGQQSALNSVLPPLCAALRIWLWLSVVRYHSRQQPVSLKRLQEWQRCALLECIRCFPTIHQGVEPLACALRVFSWVNLHTNNPVFVSHHYLCLYEVIGQTQQEILSCHCGLHRHRASRDTFSPQTCMIGGLAYRLDTSAKSFCNGRGNCSHSLPLPTPTCPHCSRDNAVLWEYNYKQKLGWDCGKNRSSFVKV